MSDRLIKITLLSLSILFIYWYAEGRKKIYELQETVDYLSNPTNQIVIVVNENIKSKRDRTRNKIEDIISCNKYQPLPSDQLDFISNSVVRYSERYKVPINLILSIMAAESQFISSSISNVGAVGVIQVMPYTAQEIAHELGVKDFDLFSLDTNIRFGTYYLNKMLKVFNDDIGLAVRAYNAGSDNILKNIYPLETIEYHKKVMSVYNWLEAKNYKCETLD